MKRPYFLCALPALALFFSASPSEARRTVIDSEGTIVTLGYCDLNGDDCDAPLVLPYLVDFGSGFTNLAFVHGNGILSFGAPIDFNLYSDGSGGYNLPSSIGGFSGTLFGGALNNFYGPNFFDPDPIRSQQNVFDQAGKASLQGNVITATWYGCNGPSNCLVNPSTMTMTPQANGFLVSLAAGSYVAPATFRYSASGVPEPAAWMMMLAGFGTDGFLRACIKWSLMMCSRISSCQDISWTALPEQPLHHPGKHYSSVN